MSPWGVFNGVVVIAPDEGEMKTDTQQVDLLMSKDRLIDKRAKNFNVVKVQKLR